MVLEMLDVSAIGYFSPILAFLLVFSVVFAILLKIKIIGENKQGILFISFVIATIFISFAGVREYVLVVTPWIVVLVLSLFFVLMLIAFLGKIDDMKKGLGVGALVIAGLIFLISGFVVFSDIVSSYWVRFLLSPRIAGAVVLIIAASLTSWILVRAKGEDKK